MEWHIMNKDSIGSILSDLGCYMDGYFIISEDAEESLNELLNQLLNEPAKYLHVQQYMAQHQSIEKTIIPLLLNLSEESDTTKKALFALTIRCLAYITQPMDCVGLQALASSLPKHEVDMVKQFLFTVKTSFQGVQVIQVLVNEMKNILQQEGELDNYDVQTLNVCILVLRNILYIAVPGCTTVDINIMMNALDCGLGEVILLMTNCSKIDMLAISLVQLISLLYKHDPINKSMTWVMHSSTSSSKWTKKQDSSKWHCQTGTMSTSGKGNSNSTGAQASGSSGAHSGWLLGNQEEAPSRMLGSDDGVMQGIVSEREMIDEFEEAFLRSKGSMSPQPSSVNFDPTPTSSTVLPSWQEPTSLCKGAGEVGQTVSDGVDSEEMKVDEDTSCIPGTSAVPMQGISSEEVQQGADGGKQFDSDGGKVSFNSSHSGSLFSSTNTQAQYKDFRMLVPGVDAEHGDSLVKFIDNLHKFTREFITSGAGNLLKSLQELLRKKESTALLRNYYLWVLSFFVSYSLLYEPTVEFVRALMTIENIGAVVYIAVKTSEEARVGIAGNKDIAQLEQQLNLVVTCIGEMLRLIQKCTANLEGEEDEEWFKFNCQMLKMQDLRHLFLLLIHSYNPRVQSLQFISCLISTNHRLLELFEEISAVAEQKYGTKIFDMLSHVKNFATRSVMHVYGLVLAKFVNNSPKLNDSIFTMMHHVAGDCKKPEVLFQLQILKTFQKIWSHPVLHTLPHECQQLMNFIEQTFMEHVQTDPEGCAYHLFFSDMDMQGLDDSAEDTDTSNWSSNELEELEELYAEHRGKDDLVDQVVQGLSTRNIHKSADEITRKLMNLQLLSSSGSDDTDQEHKSQNKCGGERSGNCTSDSDVDQNASVQDLVLKLEQKSIGQIVSILKNSLLEAAFVRLGGVRLHPEIGFVEEPVISFACKQEVSIPVLWHMEDEVLNDPTFSRLLLLMGFHRGEDTGNLFARMPSFWTVEDYLEKAGQLGPISDECKFTPADFAKHKGLKYTEIPETDYQPEVPMKQAPNYQWLWFVRQCNAKKREEHLLSHLAQS